jgi:hypothetical protein
MSFSKENEDAAIVGTTIGIIGVMVGGVAGGLSDLSNPLSSIVGGGVIGGTLGSTIGAIGSRVHDLYLDRKEIGDSIFSQEVYKHAACGAFTLGPIGMVAGAISGILSSSQLSPIVRAETGAAFGCAILGATGFFGGALYGIYDDYYGDHTA